MRYTEGRNSESTSAIPPGRVLQTLGGASTLFASAAARRIVSGVMRCHKMVLLRALLQSLCAVAYKPRDNRHFDNRCNVGARRSFRTTMHLPWHSDAASEAVAGDTDAVVEAAARVFQRWPLNRRRPHASPKLPA